MRKFLTKHDLKLTNGVFNWDIHCGHGQIYAIQILNSCNKYRWQALATNHQSLIQFEWFGLWNTYNDEIQKIKTQCYYKHIDWKHS